MITVTVPVAKPPWPSLIVYVNVSTPLNPGTGEYWTEPSL